MIRVILKGGLGNQMFQYAFGKALALTKKQNLILDTSFLDCRIPVKGFTLRNYELDLFSIPEKPQKPVLPDSLHRYISYPLLKLSAKVNPNYLTEGVNAYSYEKELVDTALKSTADVTLEGYWNNYLYFEDHSEEIRQIFNTDKLYDGNYNDIEKDILNSNSVSINIRRGDYLNTKHKDVFVYLDKDYYTKAVNIIRSRVNKPKFFVFSYDDPDWVKKELEFNNDELVVVGKEYVGEKFKTYLRLISMCKHNIISNSTFAFWGAYLNQNNNPIRITPSQWMKGINFDTPYTWEGLIINEEI